MADETTQQSQESQDVSWDLGSLFSTQTEDTSNTSNEEGNTENQTKKEIPITDREEALSFAYGEMGKLMRNDGHQIELKLIGNINYRVGAWIRVFLPSFNEDCMMFITKAQQEASADSEWITSLTLVDYPPSLSKGEDNSASNSDSSSSDGDSSESEEEENEESGGSSSGSETSPLSSTQLWNELLKIVHKYYPRSQNPTKWVIELRNAPTNWTGVAKVVNRMGGDSNKQNNVIRQVLALKKRLKTGSSSGNGKVTSQKGYVKKSNAPQNTRKKSSNKKKQAGYKNKLNRG